MNHSDKALIFLHIPKAAGTTLNSIIAHNYKAEEIFSIRAHAPLRLEDFERLPLAERARYRFVKGHFTFGIHECMPQPAVYITMLRDPIERSISHYHYVLRRPSHPLHEHVKSRKMTLREYVEMPARLDNGQVRMISGASRSLPRGQCTREMLETAKLNLERSFAVVGLVERFDESILLWRRLFGWKIPFYAKQNVTENRPLREALSPEELEALYRTNELDVDLYQHACCLLERAIRNQPQSFHTELGQFRKFNANLWQASQRFEEYRRRPLPWFFWPGAWRARWQRNALRKAAHHE